jgi:beta-phosphoglucomutase family hydrolase
MNQCVFEAVIFDLDGVITDTAAIHSSAWKEMFDEYLFRHAEKNKIPFKAFTHEHDYLPYVDGKPRYKGVASFLESRQINISFGNPSESPNEESICGLGNRKNQLFNEFIKGGKVKIFQSTVDFIHELKKHGVRIGVASSSKNCKTVLKATQLLPLFETCVDGIVSAKLGLKGKPEPDIFTTACDNLKAAYNNSVIVEDAVSGVQAGRNGNFGMVIGIAREDNVDELKLNGADIVITDMAEIDLPTIENWFNQST